MCVCVEQIYIVNAANSMKFNVLALKSQKSEKRIVLFSLVEDGRKSLPPFALERIPRKKG